MQPNKSYTEHDYYRSYVEYTGGVGIYKVSEKKFRAILNDYFKHLAEEIILRSKEIKLPANMGRIYVRKSKPAKLSRDNLRVDFKATMENHFTVMHMNEHSDGYNYMFKWEKLTMIAENKNCYELVMSRKNKRWLSYCIKNKIADYIEHR